MATEATTSHGVSKWATAKAWSYGALTVALHEGHRVAGAFLSNRLVRFVREPAQEYAHYKHETNLAVSWDETEGYETTKEFDKARGIGKIARCAGDAIATPFIALGKTIYNNTILNFRNHTWTYLAPAAVGAGAHFIAGAALTTVLPAAGAFIGAATLVSLLSRHFSLFSHDCAVVGNPKPTTTQDEERK